MSCIFTGLNVCFCIYGQIFFQNLSSQPELKLPSAPASPIIDPHLSPDGTMLAYVRDHELHVLDLLQNESKQITSGADGNTSVSVHFCIVVELGFHSFHSMEISNTFVVYHTFYGMPMLRKMGQLRIL